MKEGLITALAEISEVDDSHPSLAKMQFILATANEGFALSTKKPGLKQGIKEEDLDDVIKTAINAPIKMRYLGYRGGVGNHLGSIPIGHITGVTKTTLEDGTPALIADSVLYATEYPEEVDYLKTAFAAKEAPGISYEIIYNNKQSLIEEGVEWLKGLITQAATIVKSPAYGSRTAILALASNGELTNEEFTEEVRLIITPTEASDEGGSDMDKDKEIERLTALASEKEAALVTKNTELENLQKDLEESTKKLAEASTENETLKRTILVETRAKAFTDAGLAFEADADKATAKKELLAKMDEDVFTSYIDDLKSANEKKGTAALASASDRGVPNLRAQEGNKSLDDLKAGVRGITRA